MLILGVSTVGSMGGRASYSPRAAQSYRVVLGSGGQDNKAGCLLASDTCYWYPYSDECGGEHDTRAARCAKKKKRD